MNLGLIFDWLVREGGEVLRWWLFITLAGAAAWPLLYRMLSGLPDRGYGLARAAGLMLTGFVFWFLGSVGLLRNTPGGIALAWLIVLAAALTVFFRGAKGDGLPMRTWARQHRALILTTEAVFLLLLVGWAAFRAANPEMRSTEKPMELMFLNSIRASANFPPQDAWLSGYAISYYYFGYVIVAALADLAGVTSGTAFNLAIASTFALTGIGALSVVYNMVRSTPRGAAARARWAIGAGVAALVMLTVMGSLGTALVELPYQGYASGLVNEAYFDFWDVEGRAGTVSMTTENGTISAPVDDDRDGVPNWDDDALPFDRFSFTYGVGWRYSRVVHDRQLDGTPHPIQPITEFPNFSFILADIHPHVLALPFAVLAVGLALNLVLKRRDPALWEMGLYAVWVGGMVFMNSWDAVYLGLLFGAEVLRRLMRDATGVLDRRALWGAARFALVVGGLTLALYLPWIISFTSQAGGVMPNVIYPTRWQQLFLQFGAFLILLAAYLVIEMRRAGRRFNWEAGGLAVFAAALLAAAVIAALGTVAWGRDDLRQPVFSVYAQGEGLGALLPDILSKRAAALPGELLLLAFIFVVVGRLFARPLADSVAAVPVEDRMEGSDGVLRVRAITYSPATGFALLLIGAAAVLVLAPDVVYLRDNFAVRINTVFKLYYQGWILFSLATGFALWSVLVDGEPGKTRIVPAGRWVYAGVAALLVVMGLLYPVLAGRGRALVDSDRLRKQAEIRACESDRGRDLTITVTCGKLPDLTLDGTPQMVSADEYTAAQCLARLEPGGTGERVVIVEAPGGAYEPDRSRFSALTGLPTLIGWQNHERQWRGESYPRVIDTRIENGVRRDRVSDVQDLYTTQDWNRAWQIIDRYGIDYIVVGGAERRLPGELAGDDESRRRDLERGLNKFEQVLQPVCQSGAVAVYRVGGGR